MLPMFVFSAVVGHYFTPIIEKTTIPLEVITSVEWVQKEPPPVVYGVSNLLPTDMTVFPPPGTWTWVDRITQTFGVSFDVYDINDFLNIHDGWNESPFDRAPGNYPGSYNYNVGMQVIPVNYGLVVEILYEECRADESETGNGIWNVEPGSNLDAFILVATSIDEELMMVQRKDARVQKNHVAVPRLINLLFESDPNSGPGANPP